MHCLRVRDGKRGVTGKGLDDLGHLAPPSNGLSGAAPTATAGSISWHLCQLPRTSQTNSARVPTVLMKQTKQQQRKRKKPMVSFLIVDHRTSPAHMRSVSCPGESIRVGQMNCLVNPVDSLANEASVFRRV